MNELKGSIMGRERRDYWASACFKCMSEYAEEFYEYKHYAWNTRNAHRSSLNTLRYAVGSTEQCVTEDFLVSLRLNVSIESNIRVLMKYASIRCGHCGENSPQSFRRDGTESWAFSPRPESRIKFQISICEDIAAIFFSLAVDRNVQPEMFLGTLIRRLIDAELFDKSSNLSSHHRGCHQIQIQIELEEPVLPKLEDGFHTISETTIEALLQVNELIHLPLFQRL